MRKGGTHSWRKVQTVFANALLVSLLLGSLAGTGALLLLSSLRFWRTPSLTQRIQPYLRDVLIANESNGSGLSTLSNYRSFRDYLKSKVTQSSLSLAATQRLLIQAGRTTDVAEYRWFQIQAAALGAALGLVIIFASWMLGALSITTVLLPIVLAAAFAILVELGLKASAKRRVRQMRDELPTVLEFLALSLTAGETLRDALQRTATAHGGELGVHLERVLLASKTGSRLADALSEMAAALDLPALHRAVEQLRSALSSGAPLAEVLHSQAMDVRAEQKRELLEAAGKKELQMLIPLVFLVLPISVVFAIFPGVYLLQNSFN